MINQLNCFMRLVFNKAQRYLLFIYKTSFTTCYLTQYQTVNRRFCARKTYVRQGTIANNNKQKKTNIRIKLINYKNKTEKMQPTTTILQTIIFICVVFSTLTKGESIPEIHIVPHSHDDAGWQVTVDEYQFSTVDAILDTVLIQLEKNSNRTFVYGEMNFLASWIRRRGEDVRKRFFALVNKVMLLR